MSFGELRSSQWEREHRRQLARAEAQSAYRAFLQRLERVQYRVQRSRWDADLKARLQGLADQGESLRAALAREDTETGYEQLRQRFERLSKQVEEIEATFRRREALREQRKAQLDERFTRLRRRWQAIQARLQRFSHEARKAHAEIERLWSRLEETDLSQTEAYQKYMDAIERTLDRWEQLLVREAEEQLKEHLDRVHLEEIRTLVRPAQAAAAPDLWAIPTDEAARERRRRMQALWEEVEALAAYLTAEEWAELEAQEDPDGLERLLRGHQEALARLQARGQGLLDTYGWSRLLAPTLRRLRRALEEQDWALLRHLVPVLERWLEDPAWAMALTLEAFLREYFKDYELVWEEPARTLRMTEQGEGNVVRLTLSPETGSVQVQPERETPTFCATIERMAQEQGLTWIPQEQRRERRYRAAS